MKDNFKERNIIRRSTFRLYAHSYRYEIIAKKNLEIKLYIPQKS